MAQNENILTRLGKLFQSNIIVRKTPKGQLKVKDLNLSQGTPLVNNFIDRYSKLMGTAGNMTWAGKQNQRNAYETARLELFKDYETKTFEKNVFFFMSKIYFENMNIVGNRWFWEGFEIAHTAKNMKFGAKTHSKGSSNLSVGAQTL